LFPNGFRIDFNRIVFKFGLTVSEKRFVQALVMVELSRIGTSSEMTDVKYVGMFNVVESEPYGFIVSEGLKGIVFQYPTRKADENTILPKGAANVFRKLKYKLGCAKVSAKLLTNCFAELIEAWKLKLEYGFRDRALEVAREFGIAKMSVAGLYKSFMKSIALRKYVVPSRVTTRFTVKVM